MFWRLKWLFHSYNNKYIFFIVNKLDSFFCISNKIKFLTRLIESIFYWPKHGNIAYIQKPLLSSESIYFEKILRKRYKFIIFDLDDALMVSQPCKISLISKLSNKVIVGNRYLQSCLHEYDEKIKIIPTPVEILQHNKLFTDNLKVIIGWIGTASNYKYIHSIENSLHKIIESNKEVEIWVIGGPTKFEFNTFSTDRLKFIYWKEADWQDHLKKINIGIMPLIDDNWAKGKCSFKLLQYMSAGIPSVASSIGMNSDVICHGENSFLADTEEEWVEYIQKLVNSLKLRVQMGNKATQTVVDEYSILVNFSKLKNIIESLN